jgi:hypothetical protein
VRFFWPLGSAFFFLACPAVLWPALSAVERFEAVGA